jgi:hypothetical protein
MNEKEGKADEKCGTRLSGDGICQAGTCEGADGERAIASEEREGRERSLIGTEREK